MKRLIISTLSILALTSLQSANAGSVQSIGSSNDLQQLLNSNKHVVVEFYDSQCGACQRYRRSGEFEKAARSYNNVKFADVDMRRAQSVFQTYGVQRVPSFVFFANGKQVNTHMGAPSYGELTSKIQQLKQN